MNHKKVENVYPAIVSKIVDILCKPIKANSSHDVIMNEIFSKEILIANKIKIIQMRLGKLYEELALFYGWKKVSKIDLIHEEFKYAIELKSSDNTDNSSSRHRNYEKLLEFQKNNLDYELFYVCINSTKSKGCNNKLPNNITFLSGNYALQFLFGDDYNYILKMIKDVFFNKINGV